VFRPAPSWLRGGQRVAPNDLRGLLLEGESALQTVVVRGIGARKRKFPVANFFLEVWKHQAEANEGWFFADGFFHLPDRIQRHTLFNPYQVKVLEQKGGRYTLKIRDKNGNPISVDGDGHVNDLKALRSFRTKEIITVASKNKKVEG
jgi:hypothetical protein